MSEYSIALVKQIAALDAVLSDRGRMYAKEAASHRPFGEQDILGLLVRGLSLGETFYCAPHICKLLEFAAPGIREWIFNKASVPSRYGFVWFATPLSLPKWEGGSEGSNVTALSWTTIHKLPKDNNLEMGMGKGSLIRLVEPDDPSPTFVEFTVYVQSEWMGEMCPVTSLPLEDGQSLSDLVKEGQSAETISNVARFEAKIAIVATLLTFIQQRLFVFQRESVDRAARRQAARAFQEEPVLNVIKLRRRAGQNHSSKDGEEMEWSCQWLVRGHWRLQWYPSVNLHQSKWIMPYVKGPDDKPMKDPRATVFAVVR